MAITMEELKRKARAYDEMREKIALRFGSNVAEEIFSEYEMDEDEKVRKAIISGLKYLETELGWDAVGEVDILDIYTWLEKQSSNNIKWNKNTKDNKPQVNHSVLMQTTYGIAEGEWKGEDWYTYRWAGIIKDNKVIAWIELSDIEKQSKESKVEEAMREVEEKAEAFTAAHQGENADVILAEMRGEMKPKFHEGDWVVYNNDICQIVKREEGCNKLVTVFGIEKELVNERNLSTARLWSIKDAKDGDVLSYVTDEEDLWIMIYLSLYEPYEGHVHYHALLVNDNFTDKGTCCICIDNLKPSTKEQRDTLFAKMKDAGWEFDFEKKELKKLGQQEVTKTSDQVKDSNWSEEDDHRAKDTIYFLDTAKKHYASTVELDACIDWLKSLKDKVQPQPQPKQGWREEDEKMLDNCINALGDSSFVNTYEIEEWVKSLRQRIGG